MDASTQTLRERMAGYMRWLLGRDMAERQQRQQVERNIPNGVIRQQQDPDYDLAQGQRTRQAPQGVTREGSEAFMPAGSVALLYSDGFSAAPLLPVNGASRKRAPRRCTTSAAACMLSGATVQCARMT